LPPASICWAGVDRHGFRGNEVVVAHPELA